MKVERVIFVCKGNICRSAYAEYIFKSINETPSCSIGLDTQTGHPANTRVLKAAEKRGLSLSLHRTTSVTDFRSNTGDLFVCVEPKHAEEVEQRFGGACSVMLLGALCGPGHVYIHDPYSAGDDYLNSCLDLIDAAVRKLSLLIGEKVKM